MEYLPNVFYIFIGSYNLFKIYHQNIREMLN
jgi:hypothetical protein